MNVVIAGKNNIAVNVAGYMLNNYGSYNYYAVINSNDIGVNGFQRSFLKYCTDRDIQMLSLEDIYLLDDILLLSLEFDRIVKPHLFHAVGLYNIHFSLLPKYKGMYTSAWPILNGDSFSGVTLHKIDNGIDTGDIIVQRQIELSNNETARSLYLKYIDIGTKLVIDYIHVLLSGDVHAEMQSPYGASYYSNKSIDYKSLSVDFNKTAFEVSRQVNAYTFREYQILSLFGECIFGVDISCERSVIKPGAIVSKNDDTIIVATVDYDIVLYIDKFDELIDACRKGDLSTVKRVLKNKRLVCEKDERGWSAIIVAAYNGFLDVVKYLTDSGANVNDKNNNGTTVLMYAKDYLEKSGDDSVLNFLIENGADLFVDDYSGLSVFDYVKKSGNHYSKTFFKSYV